MTKKKKITMMMIHILTKLTDENVCSPRAG